MLALMYLLSRLMLTQKDADANVSALKAALVSPLKANAGTKDADANVSALKAAGVGRQYVFSIAEWSCSDVSL